MKKYFSNETLQQQFNAKGYVIIDLLDKNVIQELLHFYQETHQNGGEGFHCTLYNPDFSKKKHIDQKLKTMLSPIIKQHLSNFKPLIANFAVKEPQASGINLHQDWCFVDESKHFSLNIWLPLVDVDEKNGCYHVISGSHKIYRTFRGTNIPLSCQEIMPQIDFQQMTRLEIKC